MASRQSKQEAPEYRKFIDRLVRAMARRAASGDLDSLKELCDLHKALSAVIADAGAAAHGDFPGCGPQVPYSYGEMAAVLGCTRQAARQRFMTGAARAEDVAA